MKDLTHRVIRAAMFVAVTIMPAFGFGLKMETMPTNVPNNLYSRQEGIHSQLVFPMEATGPVRRVDSKVHDRDAAPTWEYAEKSEVSKDYVRQRTMRGEPSLCADGDSRDPSTGERLKDTAEYWGYDPGKAYAFGFEIQDAVRERNLTAFFSLVGVGVELDHGPRRKYVTNRTIREIFSDSWRAAVLNDEPPCFFVKILPRICPVSAESPILSSYVVTSVEVWAVHGIQHLWSVSDEKRSTAHFST